MSNTKQGIMAAFSRNGKLEFCRTGLDPLAVLEPVLEKIAASQRAEIRKKLGNAIELKLDAVDEHGMFFEDSVIVAEDTQAYKGFRDRGYLIVLPTEVLS